MITSLPGPGPRDDRQIAANGDDRYAIWDAAYVLGSLSAADRRAFETHLTHCPACRQAIDELAGIPAVLAEFDFRTSAANDESKHPSAKPAASPHLLPSVLGIARWRRNRSRLTVWTTAAASVFLAVSALVSQPARLFHEFIAAANDDVGPADGSGWDHVTGFTGMGHP